MLVVIQRYRVANCTNCYHIIIAIKIDMKLVVFPRLSTRSKRALLQDSGKFGWYKAYMPRKKLLERLQRELGMTQAEVIDQVRKERKFLLKIL